MLTVTYPMVIVMIATKPVSITHDRTAMIIFTLHTEAIKACCQMRHVVIFRRNRSMMLKDCAELRFLQLTCQLTTLPSCPSSIINSCRVFISLRLCRSISHLSRLLYTLNTKQSINPFTNQTRNQQKATYSKVIKCELKLLSPV
jgi:hypothetical protein